MWDKFEICFSETSYTNKMDFLFNMLPTDIEEMIVENLKIIEQTRRFRSSYDNVLGQLKLKILPDFYSKWMVNQSLEQINEWWAAGQPLSRYEDTFEEIEILGPDLYAGVRSIWSPHGEREFINSIIIDDYFDDLPKSVLEGNFEGHL